MVAASQHRLVATAVLAALASLAAASDRWVWSSQRENRQASPPPIFLPFMPPFLRRELGRQLASAASPTGQLRRPAGTEPPPVKEERVATPLLAGPRGVPQDALVVRPLPLDISKLPLESSQAEALLNVYAPNNQVFPSSGQHLEPTLPGESHLVTLPLEPGTPSHQTKAGHVEALVSTPDISLLPLQGPASSASFSPAAFGEVSVSGPEVAAATSPTSRDELVFPLKTGKQATLRTAPPPSSTPVPFRIFLRDFSGLDASPFISGEKLGDERFLKTFEALRKETLTQHSKEINLAFQNLRQLSEEHNDLQDDDRMVFPKLPNSQSFQSSKTALTLVEPPQFGDNDKSLGSRVSFSLPALHPQINTAALTAASPRLDVALPDHTLDTHTENSLTMVFKEPRAQREGRRVPPHAWLWPGEAPRRGGPQHFDQPSVHAL
ncbi:uncharacterized protein LOC127002192 [Eriocheir sinensis]|uniref:uncharacterized protein LOC127002192 n=1 Tax=Eriocheir sinensis TaxID=95602 RepID=UPI0021C7597B|nr:uncharacterized protein LOC127002192 [Eriocheir sinensis]